MYTAFLNYEGKLYNRVKSIRCINHEDSFCIFFVKHFVNSMDSSFTSGTLSFTKLQWSGSVWDICLEKFYYNFSNGECQNFPDSYGSYTRLFFSKSIDVHAKKASTFSTVLSWYNLLLISAIVFLPICWNFLRPVFYASCLYLILKGQLNIVSFSWPPIPYLN